MFRFVIKHFGFLKHVPLLALIFDSQLRLWMMFANSRVPDYLDEIEAEVTNWPGCTVSLHKYGGTQFNYKGKEIGHVHSNGLLDILFDLNTKKAVMTAGRIKNHHTLTKSGWISFYIKTKDDKDYAVELLKMTYERRTVVDLK